MKEDHIRSNGGNNDCWQRLWRVINNEGMNVNQFALSIGLTRSETLYQIKRGNTAITRSMASRIIAKYPYYSMPWLITGCGPMIANVDDNAQYIPYYTCDICDISLVETMQPESHIFLPQAGDADLALTYRNDDMVPSIPNGTIIVLKQKPLESVIYGDEHVVVCDNFVMLRRIRRMQDVRMLRLESVCREYYDDIIVSVSDVRAVYAVRTKIIVKR